ncbi:MAG TPA: hypothetical protein VGS27_16420 [Candidatus Sulfotelmatobacter sp.]|nr:hypothetical protein [Candidatus Sulfotelmatobacter sp.]
MQIHEFAENYRVKSDEELIQLAAAPDQLTAEARIALHGELSRRQIDIAEDSPASQAKGGDAVQTAVNRRLRQGEQQGVGDFVAETLRTYHADFWLYFKIAAPAVIISTFAIIASRHEVREISRHLPRGVELLAHHTEILEIGLINYSAWFVSWMAFSFMFGATCIAVEEKAAGFSPSSWRSFLSIRERLGSFLCVSLLLLVVVVIAEAASVLLGTGVFWVLHQWRVHTTGFLIKAVSYGLVGLAILIVSRFSLAVPAVILDDCRIWQAMLRSDEITRGKWPILAALLAKSLIGGYIAGMSPFWLASFIPATVPLPSWFPWILTGASIIGVSIVEPTMFIGFGLLYLKMPATPTVSTHIRDAQISVAT